MMTIDSIIQWNVRGVTSAKSDLIKLIEMNTPTAIAVQETFLGNDYMIKIPGYNSLCKQGHYLSLIHI